MQTESLVVRKAPKEHHLSRHVGVKLAPADFQKIAGLAKEQGVSLSTAVRRLLASALGEETSSAD